MESNEITLQQALQAQEYVKSFIRFNGGDPFDDGAMEPKNWWPEDVKKAAETYDLFLEKIEKDDIIP